MISGGKSNDGTTFGVIVTLDIMMNTNETIARIKHIGCGPSKIIAGTMILIGSGRGIGNLNGIGATITQTHN
jgi:hypothetical protein